ncbi:phosphatidic acid phosphatase type 2/haloperoxidase, partial [Tricladium varicosporioides]
YAIDWLIIPIFGAAILAMHLLPPTQTQFSLLEPKIYFKYHEKEIFPIWLAIVVCAGLPMFVTFIFCIWGVGNITPSRRVWRSKLVDLHHTWLGLAYAAMASGVLSILSQISGQPRPDFIERCKPNPEAYKDDSIMLYRAGVTNTSICMTTDIKLLQSGFMSFPSGHATTGFAGLAYLSYFLALRLSVFNLKSKQYNLSERASVPLVRIFISILPLILAAFESVSRVLDNRHHPFDVIVGTLGGLACAWIGCRFVLLPNARRMEKIEEIPLNSTFGADTQYPESIPLTGINAI